jgi:SAM-dependent methyltransferase
MAEAGARRPGAEARRAYDALAAFYDAFTAHHDYASWTATLERLAVRHGLAGRRLLDVGCGTGKSFLPFLARGYDVVACDVSPAMVERAAAKAAGAADVRVLDLCELPAMGARDLVLCLDDVLNYVTDPADLVPAFRGVRRNLAPDGVFVFDVNTLATYRSFFAGLTVVPSDELVLVWTGRTATTLAAGGLAAAGIQAFVQDDGGWRRETHDHVQRHHPQEVIRDALAAGGLACAGVYGMQLDGSLEEGATELGNSKTVYVARRG